MNIGGVVLRPFKTLLYGFARECVYPERVIRLPVTFGEEPAAATQIVDFLVMNQRSAYNAIIGRPNLNKLKVVVVSTYHLMMKFLTEERIRVIKEDQTSARVCYAMVTKANQNARVVSTKANQNARVVSTIYQVDEVGVIPQEVQTMSDLDP
ncbi:hypothetical protein TorRG33x02_288830 [Trema orientale]|uniref:Uncharacterized protein n=1 Tax=Trema orientale TaxID=63057 RepID=A0A2P5CDX2_TREOI|nr:hypothetical protein TorRG33x02_288830 [Trema orientale]